MQLPKWKKLPVTGLGGADGYGDCKTQEKRHQNQVFGWLKGNSPLSKEA